MTDDAPAIRYDERGLVPVVVAEDGGPVLMLAYANAEAVERTRTTGYAHFFSRSRGRLWKKGETSGATLRVREVRIDCDGDALLYLVAPDGPACHTGERSCFFRALSGERRGAPGLLAELEETLAARKGGAPEDSYTARLFAAPAAKTHEKIGEEAFEVVLASEALESAPSANARDAFVWEAADLFFHLLVLLARHGVPFARVVGELRRRRR